MPELPEVETVLRGLRQRALGKRVAAVEVLSPLVIVGDVNEFRSTVGGRVIASLERKGKALAAELQAPDGLHQAPRYLLLRLGMTGQVLVKPRRAPLEPHTHLRLLLEAGEEEIRYRDVRRFGRLRCCTPEGLRAVFERLGPDAGEITLEQFREALRGRRGAIKSWLMNQQWISGLGNIYADESLFAARIHPLAIAGRLSSASAARLHRSVQRVLHRAVALQGTSFRDYMDIEGRPGNFFPRLMAYQRTGKPCRRCGRSIRRIIVAGRSSHFCPRCQPRPRHCARVRGPNKKAAAGAD